MKNIQFLNKEITAIGIGTWNVGNEVHIREQEIAAIRCGIELGATLIDTAEMYGEGLSELLIAEAIQPYDRGKLQLVSKVYPWNATKEGTRVSLENSLRRLNTDYLDLYLLHWLEDVPLEETIDTLEQLKLEGKIHNWGVSNLDLPEMKKVVSLSSNCVTNQVLYHIGSRGIDYDLKPWMDEQKIVTMAYSPLAHGDKRFLEHPRLIQLANEYNITVAQLMLAWVCSQSNTIAIAKSSKIRHVQKNMEALNVVISKKDMLMIDRIFPKPSSKQPLAEL